MGTKLSNIGMKTTVLFAATSKCQKARDNGKFCRESPESHAIEFLSEIPSCKIEKPYTHIAQYVEKKRQSKNEIWSVNIIYHE